MTYGNDQYPTDSQTVLAGTPLFQTMHLQRFESGEIAVIRENAVDTVLLAHQPLSAHRTSGCRANQQLGRSQAVVAKLGTWLQYLATRSGRDTFDERSRLRDRRRRVEFPLVGHHPHEFRNAGHRNRPSIQPSLNVTSRAAASCNSLTPMRVGQDVRIDCYHYWSITLYSASRSLISTLGGASPVTVLSRKRNGAIRSRAAARCARRSSSTNLVSLIPSRAARPLAWRRT